MSPATPPLQRLGAGTDTSAASKATETEKPKPWVRIRGQCVDLASFRHPGGNIVSLFYGLEATSAFEAFHGHSQKAQRTVATGPS